MSEDIAIVEDKHIVFKEPTVIEGLPDVGLVGAIATSYIVETLGLEQIGHIESSLFPPLMVIHKGVLSDPVRIFGNKDLLVLTSEIPIPPMLIYPVTRSLVSWFKEKGVRLVVSLTGYPEQARVEIENPSVMGVANSPEASDLLKKSGLEFMQEGFVAGTYAVMMRECQKTNIPAVGLLAQAFPNYPDPGAAAAVIQTAAKLLKLKIDVGPLLEKADEIRVKARDLMKQAQGSMMGVKNREQEIPLMYR